MSKLIIFCLCVIAMAIGITGGVAEICRVMAYRLTITDMQMVGELMLTAVYGGMAVLAAVRIVRLWNAPKY